MFEFVRTHTRLLQFLLVLLIFPSFVLFGIEGYSKFNDPSQQPVAEVGGYKITQTEWDAIHRQQLERARRQMPDLDVALFDSPEMKRSTLDGIVRERVSLTAVQKLHLATPNERLQRLFVADPQFASIRNADGSVNKDILMAQGLSSEQFAEQLRQEYSTRQVFGGITDSALAPVAATSGALDALFQQREIHVQRYLTKDYLAKVEPTDAELKAWYDDPAHQAAFRTPEQARIEYLVLDLDAVAKTITVPEDELRKYYDENAARYSQPEERRASHILIKAEKSAPEAERAKAKAKAESLLPEARKSAEAFAELAKKHSDDPGSASKGGDLDWFGRNAMVKPFEDATWALKPGETSGVVESDFGYHIIRLAGLRGGDKRSFESVRAEIEAEARKQQAQKRYAEEAEQFTNLVFEQSDSLKPAADKLKLEIRSATVQREPAPDAPPALSSAKLLKAVFSNDVLRDKRNTEAIDTGSSQLVSARVVEYQPARLKAYDEVKAEVRDALVRQRAAALARQDGEARLAAGRKDPATTLPGEAITFSRATPKDLSPELVDAALKADAAQLPAWTGVDLGSEGYAVVRIEKVLGRDPVVGDPQRAQAQYAQAWSAAESAAYYDGLKQRFKVTLHEDAVRRVAAAASAP